MSSSSQVIVAAGCVLWLVACAGGGSVGNSGGGGAGGAGGSSAGSAGPAGGSGSGATAGRGGGGPGGASVNTTGGAGAAGAGGNGSTGSGGVGSTGGGGVGSTGSGGASVWDCLDVPGTLCICFKRTATESPTCSAGYRCCFLLAATSCECFVAEEDCTAAATQYTQVATCPPS
jgi:hypothetical protein